MVHYGFMFWKNLANNVESRVFLKVGHQVIVSSSYSVPLYIYIPRFPREGRKAQSVTPPSQMFYSFVLLF